MLKKLYYDRKAKKFNQQADLFREYNQAGLKYREPAEGSRAQKIKRNAEFDMTMRRSEIKKRLEKEIK